MPLLRWIVVVHTQFFPETAHVVLEAVKVHLIRVVQHDAEHVVGKLVAVLVKIVGYSSRRLRRLYIRLWIGGKVVGYFSLLGPLFILLNFVQYLYTQSVEQLLKGVSLVDGLRVRRVERIALLINSFTQPLVNFLD